jgi:hypothetical protein
MAIVTFKTSLCAPVSYTVDDGAAARYAHAQATSAPRVTFSTKDLLGNYGIDVTIMTASITGVTE